MFNKKQSLSSRQIKRNNKKKDIKNISRTLLIGTIIRHLDFIFDDKYNCQNPDKEEKFINFQPLLEHCMLSIDKNFVEQFPDVHYTREINTDYLERKNKKALLMIYTTTSKAATWLARHHNIKTELINGKKDG